MKRASLSKSFAGRLGREPHRPAAEPSQATGQSPDRANPRPTGSGQLRFSRCFGRSVWARCWLCAILLTMVALTPLAYASPPDPSWIRGLYDAGDFDDVVVMLTGGTGVIEPFPLDDVCPLLLVMGDVLQVDVGSVPTPTLLDHPARGPPA